MKVLLKEWVKNVSLKFSKTHSQVSKLPLEKLGLNIILHILPGNLPDSQPICHSHFSCTMDHGNSRWMLQVNLESDQATSFLKNLTFCNAILGIQTLVTYYCFAKELLSLCKTTYSFICAFICALIFPTRKYYSWEGKRIISEYLMSILKKKHLLEKWMYPYKNNRKELQN